MTRVKDLLSDKSTSIHTISDSASVLDAIRQMIQHRVGCLVVTHRDGTIGGIVAEQDILKRMAREQSDVRHLAVGDIMTTEVIVCTPEDSTDRVRSIMKAHHLRQLPVVNEQGQVMAIVSLETVNAHLIVEEELEIKYLHDYIEGSVR